ncbi:hypothetical protein [Haloferula sp. BvORR071]|uniref:hypothetical protein n=1 Tax=Haloferula sp. BvORR071 TaxID=1396141 RepID=UPI002240ED4F|nr:hypothetical protein [Haloferula sp. BvORR071]
MLACCALVASSGTALSQSSPYRGLWVGEATLGAVNEVAVPLDANNIPRAPDPNVPTPTSDAASLRLILHVDAAGRTSLLKQVAILGRKAGIQESENDISLVTDERLYGSFPPQAATRISSVAFDFGDAKAAAAVNQVAERAATAAATAAAQNGATQATVASAAQTAAAPVITQADATAAFNTFLQSSLDAAKVKAIANGNAATLNTARTAANALRDGSFYKDTRGVEMLDAIVATLAGLPASATQAQKEQAALNTAAAFAEATPDYDGFLAGELLGDMISEAAAAATTAANGIAPKAISGFQTAESGASTAVVSAGHGLQTGDEVAVFGTAVSAYNGIYKIVRIDNDRFRFPVAFRPGGAIGSYAAFNAIAPLTIESPGHGLKTGDWIMIQDSLESYNGKQLVTKVDADHFSVDLPFESDPAERGVWAMRSGEITGYAGTESGSVGVKITAPNHGLNNGTNIEIRGSSQAAYNGVKTITRIDADSFSIPVAFAGNPSVKGIWEIPVAIKKFTPPTVQPVLISAPNHGLASDDRIVISGSGNAAYNGEQVVTVVNANAFTIAVPWVAATGNPAVKGSWAPASGGKWRKTAAIRSALDQIAKVSQARTSALNVKVTAYSDTRAPDAVEQLLNAIVLATATEETPLATQAGKAAADALASSVARYMGPTSTPSIDYTSFVHSSEFTGSVANAAAAAATAALKEKANLLATPASIKDKAQQAALEVLAPAQAAASRALLPQLRMTGSFGPDGTGLAAEIVLPANHPTNPFRHRRHPDHTTGFDITRRVKLSFLPTDPQANAGGPYGVDRISGIYDEEIFGLHKPLGPNKDIGLKVRGSFQLHRVSQIDTLNGR